MDRIDPILKKLLAQYGFKVEEETAIGWFWDQNTEETIKLVAQIEGESFTGNKILRIYEETEDGTLEGDTSLSFDQFLVWRDSSLEPLDAKKYSIQFMCYISIEVDTEQAFQSGEAKEYQYENAEDLANQIARERLNEIAEDFKQNPEWKITLEDWNTTEVREA